MTLTFNSDRRQHCGPIRTHTVCVFSRQLPVRSLYHGSAAPTASPLPAAATAAATLCAAAAAAVPSLSLRPAQERSGDRPPASEGAPPDTAMPDLITPGGLRD